MFEWTRSEYNSCLSVVDPTKDPRGWNPRLASARSLSMTWVPVETSSCGKKAGAGQSDILLTSSHKAIDGRKVQVRGDSLPGNAGQRDPPLDLSRFFVEQLGFGHDAPVGIDANRERRSQIDRQAFVPAEVDGAGCPHPHPGGCAARSAPFFG